MIEFSIRNYYTSKVPIDDGIEGDAVNASAELPIRIRRFSVDQLKEFQKGFARLTNPSSQRFIFRKPDGDEQAMRVVPAKMSADGLRVIAAEHEEHVVPFDEIERRRLEEMSPETRSAYDVASADDDVFMATFCSDSIEKHIWLPPGVKLRVIGDNESEEIVTDGKGIVKAFGGNLSMLIRLTRAIHRENTMSPEAKKALRSLSASTASSLTPGDVAAVGGATPAATATPVVAAGSASNAAVSAAPAPSQSGSTES